MSHVYLQKANDDLVSHCNCSAADALISFPGQMDCPWCGCGWLFICGRCHKAFAFAKGIELNEPWEVTAERAIRASYDRDPEPGEVEEWVEFMQVLLEEVEPGEEYVYFDGYVLPASAAGLEIEGWHSWHNMDFVPQVAALSDPSIIQNVLCSEEYWQSRRIDDEEE